MDDTNKPKPGQHINEIKKQVDEVKSIMQHNVQTVIKRGENLDELGDRADVLERNAIQFQANAKKIRKKYWWSNMKMKLYLGIIGILILIFIIYFILS